MSDNKLLIVIGAAVLIVLAGLIYILSQDGTQTADDSDLFTEAGLPEIEPITPEQRTSLKDEAVALFGNQPFLSYNEIMERARSGRLELVSELWKIRRMCPPQMSPEDCNLRIRVFLEENFPPPGGSKLSQLFARYLKYESFMRENKPPEGLSPTEQYAWIKEQRRKIFGDAAAGLIFGYQEAKVDFQPEFAGFLEETKDMPGDERLKKFEEMRKDHFGNYYDALIEQEPSYNRFEIEMTLRENDFSEMPEDAKSSEIRSIREEYFGKDGAERMAEVDKQIALEAKREEDYNKAKTELLAAKSNLSEAEKEAELNRLRIEYFGKEEAEAYARREAYQKEMEKLSGN